MKNANVALLQLCSGENTRDNLAQIEQQIKQLNAGIKLVMTPENALLFANAASYRHHAEHHNDGPLQQEVREMARRYGVWIQVGSMPMVSRESPDLITSSSLYLMIKANSKPVTIKFTCLMSISMTSMAITVSLILISRGSS